MGDTQTQGNAGNSIGNYEVLEKVGAGAMGAVYKARQRSMDRIVALKILPPKFAANQVFVERFMREARTAGAIEHANLVKVYDVGQADGLHYFSMEYVGGPTLMELALSGPVSEADAIRHMSCLASALSLAHSRGIIHRDVKPDNVILTELGEPKLADLGLAKPIVNPADDATDGVSVGTPHYMAPEQAKGEQLDGRADLYSLGATMYRLLSGKTPYSGPSAAAVMIKHVTETPESLQSIRPELSRGLVSVIDRLMNKDPAGRYQTADELIEDLTLLSAGRKPKAARVASRTTAKTRVSTAVRAKRVTGSNRAVRAASSARRGALTPEVRKPSVPPAVLISGGVVTVLLVAGVLLWATQDDKPPRRLPESMGVPAVKIPVVATRQTNAAVVESDRGSEPVVADQPEETETTEDNGAPLSLPGPAAALSGTPVDIGGPQLRPEAANQIAARVDPDTAELAAVRQETERLERERAGLNRTHVILGEFIISLGRADMKAAGDALALCDDDPTGMIAAAKRALECTERRRSAIKEALTRPGSSDVKFSTTKGPRKGKVVAVDDAGIHIETAFKVNGKVMGVAKDVLKWSQIRPDSLRRYAPAWKSFGTDGHVAAAFERLSTRDADGADKMLAAVRLAKPDHELVDYVATRVTALRSGEKEANAQAEWKRITARLPVERLSESAAARLLKKLESFVEKFKGTEQVRGEQARITSLKAALATQSRIVLKELKALSKRVRIYSAGYSHGNRMSIEIDGQMVYEGIGGARRGISMVVVRAGTVVSKETFDTHQSGNNCHRFAEAVAGLSDGELVILAVCDEAASGYTSEGQTAILSLGGSVGLSGGQARFRWAYYLIGAKGLRQGEAIEEVSRTPLTYPPANNP